MSRRWRPSRMHAIVAAQMMDDFLAAEAGWRYASMASCDRKDCNNCVKCSSRQMCFQITDLQFEMQVCNPLFFSSQVGYHKILWISASKRGQFRVELVLVTHSIRNELYNG